MGDDPSVQPLWHSFVAGATSGFAARIVTFPADTLKARLQIKGAVSGDISHYSNTAAAARHILSTEGVGGFFRGFGAVLWGVVPANLAYFGGGLRHHPCNDSGAPPPLWATTTTTRLLLTGLAAKQTRQGACRMHKGAHGVTKTIIGHSSDLSASHQACTHVQGSSVGSLLLAVPP